MRVLFMKILSTILEDPVIEIVAIPIIFTFAVMVIAGILSRDFIGDLFRPPPRPLE